MKKLTIIKIGGNVINDQQKLDKVLSDFAAIKTPKILVHGGGKKASELLKKMGITPNMVNGRRITDAPTLEVVTMVYAGLINKNIVAQLQQKGCNALGLTGADLNSIQSHKRITTDIDYGFVGDIDSVNAPQIKQLLHAAITPVFCAITYNKSGQLLNTNADTIASSLAVALAKFYEVQLVFCFEKNGVLLDAEDENSVIPTINQHQYQDYKSAGVIYDGMIPKLDNAFDALQNQVKEVVICNATAIHSPTNGTVLCL